MAETFRVFNTSHGDVRFTVYPPLGNLDHLPRHKRRKALGNSMVHVKIPAQHSVDLVAETGLTKAELQGQPELSGMLYGPRHVLEVVVLEGDEPAKKAEPPKAPPPPAPEPVQPPEPALAIPPEPTPFDVPSPSPVFSGLAEAVASGGPSPFEAPVVERKNKGGRPPKAKV